MAKRAHLVLAKVLLGSVQPMATTGTALKESKNPRTPPTKRRAARPAVSLALELGVMVAHHTGITSIVPRMLKRPLPPPSPWLRSP